MGCRGAGAQRRGVSVEGAAPRTALPLPVLLDASAAHARVLVRMVVPAEALPTTQWRCDGIRTTPESYTKSNPRGYPSLHEGNDVILQLSRVTRFWVG